MKKMTRILAAALALVLCLGCLAACGGNSAPLPLPLLPLPPQTLPPPPLLTSLLNTQ